MSSTGIIGGAKLGGTTPSPTAAAGTSNAAAPLTPVSGTRLGGDAGAKTQQWYSGFNGGYGTSQGWGGFNSTYDASKTNTGYGKDSHLGDIQGGLQYLNGNQTVGVDKTGTVWVQLQTDKGDTVWQPYQANSTVSTYAPTGAAGAMGRGVTHQSLAGNIGTSSLQWDRNGNGVATDDAYGAAANQQLSDAANAYNALGKQNAALAQPAPTGIKSPIGATDTPAAPAVDPVNHDFISALQASIASGDNAAVKNAQDQSVTNANTMRLAAGANTLGGNYASTGAAAQSQESLLGQQDVQQANLAGSQQAASDRSTLGQALSQESSQSLAGDKAGLDQQITNVSDVIQTLQNEIKGKTDQQSLQMQSYIDSLTNQIAQYQQMAASNNFNMSSGLQIGQSILSAAGAVAAIAVAA